MTFTVLKALYGIIGEALDDIERVYHSHGQDADAVAVDGDNDPELRARDLSPHGSPSSNISSSAAKGPTSNPRSVFRHKTSLSSSSMSAICKSYASPPPSPCVATKEQRFDQRIPIPILSTSNSNSANLFDFPSLDAPFDAASTSETLTSHPTVMAAINRIISACGQMTATVQTPFLTVCDSTMSYHLPSCMRIVEAAHVVEILREYGAPGLHVDRIAQLCGIDAGKLAHILRLLATHHIFKEVSPDVFALNRISSLIDSGKSINQLVEYRTLGRPELKYQGTDGIAAFVGLCSDEINKASAYMAETYLLSRSPRIREANQPTLAPFCFAFGAVNRNVDYFGWLEGEVDAHSPNVSSNLGTEQGHGSSYSPAPGLPDPQKEKDSTTPLQSTPNISRFRLERFGKAMSGTGSWEAPGAVFNGFDWALLPRGSVVVDVGGGIGSTSMLLASAFSGADGDDLGLKFVIQDRAVVVDMGEKAWKEKCPELLDSGAAQFQVHDFFTPQPIKNAAVFLLRVVLHDWPDDYARKILLHLREAATPQTKLLLADFVLPLACADDITSESGLEGVEGAQRVLAPAPLLPNLGKASANVYWMDLTMNVMFNSQERTLREIVALSLSAGWKVVKVTQAPGSLFGYIVAIPVQLSSMNRRPSIRPITAAAPTATWNEKSTRSSSLSSSSSSGRLLSESRGWSSSLDREGGKRLRDGQDDYGDENILHRSAPPRCGTPTFGSRTELPSVAEALAKFGGGVKRYRGPGIRGRGLSTSSSDLRASSPLKPAVSLNVVKKRQIPAPLSVVTPGPISPTIPVLSFGPPALIEAPLSPSPINLQIATSPRQPPPPTPPRSLRRPASLASLRIRSGSAQVHSAEPAPPLPPPLSTAQLAAYSQASYGVQVEETPGRTPAPERPESPRQDRLQLLRRTSHAQLSPSRSGGGWGEGSTSALPVPPVSPQSLIPIRSRASGGSGSAFQDLPAPMLRKAKSRSQLQQRASVQRDGGFGWAMDSATRSSQIDLDIAKQPVGEQRQEQKEVLSASSSAVAAIKAVSDGRAVNATPGRSAVTALGSPISVRGDRSGGGTVANYLRGAGQRLGGILRFDSGRSGEEGKGSGEIKDKDKGRKSGSRLIEVGVEGGVGLAAAAKIEGGVRCASRPPSPS